MGRKAVNKVPAFVDAMVAVGTRRLSQLPACKPEDARQAMTDITASICSIYAKTVLYIPANLEPARQKRDDEIRTLYGQDGPTGAAKFTAERLSELARDFGLTPSHVYDIVRPKRAELAQAPSAAATPFQAAGTQQARPAPVLQTADQAD